MPPPTKQTHRFARWTIHQNDTPATIGRVVDFKLRIDGLVFDFISFHLAPITCDAGVYPAISVSWLMVADIYHPQRTRCSQTVFVIEFIQQLNFAWWKMLFDCDDSIAEGLDRVCPHSNCMKNILVNE